MTTLAFDAFEYAQQLRDAGLTGQQAEIIAKKTNQVSLLAAESARDEVAASKLATKRDLKEVELALKRDLKELELTLKRDMKELELQIEKSKNATLLWMFAMLTGFASGIIGIIAKGFHWF